MILDAINRSDLINRLSHRLNIDPALAEQTVKAILDKMIQSLSEGERIEIRGFGSFEVRHRAPRMARNPKTGETVQTDSKYTVHFKPGKDMKERVNDSRN